jgi:hypothetical protein
MPIAFTTRLTTTTGMFAFAFVAVTGVAQGQCEAQWQLGMGVPGVAGVSDEWGTVRTLQVWDDGSGEALYVGGCRFRCAGDHAATSVVQWNGREFTELGAGIDGWVFALAEYQGDLIAAGRINSVGGLVGPEIARWDGEQWHALGDGVNCSIPYCDKAVFDLVEFEDDLVVGGGFTLAGNAPALNIARWDGAAWHPIGAGFNGHVSAVTVYNGELIAAGGFTSSGGLTRNRIARWDGTAWQALGGGMNLLVNCLTVFEGDLIAGGYFTSAGSQLARGVARWDGQAWHAMGNQINAQVEELAVHQGKLIAVGSLNLWPSQQPLWHVAEWNGTTWSAVGDGTNYDATAVGSFGNDLIVGGSFSMAGNTPVSNLARWDGREWNQFGPATGTNDDVRALEVHAGDLIAAGDFTMIESVPANGIARFDGVQWHPLGSGVLGTHVPGWVGCVTDWHGDLIAGGRFHFAGDEPAGSVARWDGSAWHAMGSGVSGYVYAFEKYHGDLIAAGNSFDPGNVARWTGTTWESLVGSMEGSVYDLTIYRGELIAVGNFYEIEGEEINCMARWDGSAWRPFTRPFGSGHIDAAVVFQGQLIVSGCVSWPGGSFECQTARWDEPTQSWIALDSPFDIHAEDIKVIGGTLFATERNVWYAPGQLPAGVAAWNGSEWRMVGGGMDMSVYAVERFQGQLFAGGMFIIAGGEVSAYLARAPATAASPADIDCDGSVDLNDLSAVIANWGPCAAPCPPRCATDIAPIGAGDCQVNLADLLLVIANWR